jgi:hypothetical protein
MKIKQNSFHNTVYKKSVRQMLLYPGSSVGLICNLKKSTKVSKAGKIQT